MVYFCEKNRILLALVAGIFLWCQASQAIAMMPHQIKMMDCSKTMMCGVCSVALHSGAPDLSPPPPEIRAFAEPQYTTPEPHPLSLYHPPR